MKITNETKIGAIALVSIAVLILGFSFLKGKKFFDNDTVLFGKYNNVQGLQISNPVFINGLQVGSVYKISTDKNMRSILVEMNFSKDIYIPTNSIALIKQNPLGTNSIDIKLGDAATHLKTKDTLITEASSGIFGDILKKVDPVLYEVQQAVASLDSLTKNINSVIDPNAKNNIGVTLENLKRITSSMTVSTASLQAMLNQQTGALAGTLNNLNSVTGNLASNNGKITSVMTNLDKTTTNLASLNLKQTLDSLDVAVNAMKNIVGKFNSNDGSMGMLLNDPTLYKNLASTGNKLNLLLDDIRVHPKRYVNISVFGKKGNIEPLKVPTPDTLQSPYYIRKAVD